MFDELDVDDRECDYECNTVGGFCSEMLEHTPEVGESFEYKNLRVEVIKVDDVRVEEVKVTVNELPKEDE